MESPAAFNNWWQVLEILGTMGSSAVLLQLIAWMRQYLQNRRTDRQKEDQQETAEQRIWRREMQEEARFQIEENRRMREELKTLRWEILEHQKKEGDLFNQVTLLQLQLDQKKKDD